jgi:hypothetical protein
LTLHIAAWFAAGAIIIASFIKIYSPTKFQSYCMWAVFATYSILFLLNHFKISLFLERSGLYASFYLFLSYLFIGSILPNSIRNSTALSLGGLFLASLILRFKLGADITTKLPMASSWAVGLALGSLLAVVGGLPRNKMVRASAATVALVLTLYVVWPFGYEGTIYAARDTVARSTGK